MHIQVTLIRIVLSGLVAAILRNPVTSFTTSGRCLIVTVISMVVSRAIQDGRRTGNVDKGRSRGNAGISSVVKIDRNYYKGCWKVRVVVNGKVGVFEPVNGVPDIDLWEGICRCRGCIKQI